MSQTKCLYEGGDNLLATVKSYDHTHRRNFCAYLRCQGIDDVKRCWCCSKVVGLTMTEFIQYPWKWTTDGFTFSYCENCQSNAKVFIWLLKKDLECFSLAQNPSGSFQNWLSGDIVSRI